MAMWRNVRFCMEVSFCDLLQGYVWLLCIVMYCKVMCCHLWLGKAFLTKFNYEERGRYITFAMF